MLLDQGLFPAERRELEALKHLLSALFRASISAGNNPAFPVTDLHLELVRAGCDSPQQGNQQLWGPSGSVQTSALPWKSHCKTRAQAALWGQGKFGSFSGEMVGMAWFCFSKNNVASLLASSPEAALFSSIKTKK